MNQSPNVETALAICLEQLERSPSNREGQEPATAEIVHLLELAHEIRGLPPVKPDAEWLRASKGRLMDRFSALRGGPDGAALQTEA